MVIVETNSPDAQHLSNAGTDECGPLILPLQRAKIARNVILNNISINTTQEPKLKEYSEYSERLKTFKEWSQDSAITSKALSEAGFIYCNKADLTSCFHCGGSLFTWDDYDDPWIEHAYWFSDCQFVLSVKGKKFVEDAFLMKYKQKEQEIKAVKKKDYLAHTLKKMKEKVKIFEEFITDDINDETNESPSDKKNNGELTKKDGIKSKLKTSQDSKKSCFTCLGRDCCH